MDQEFLKILVCPRSKKSLILADKKILDQLNQKIKHKEIKHISGEPITANPEAALLEKENGILYLIEDDIPNLIYENGIQWNHY